MSYKSKTELQSISLDEHIREERAQAEYYAKRRIDAHGREIKSPGGYIDATVRNAKRRWEEANG